VLRPEEFKQRVGEHGAVPWAAWAVLATLGCLQRLPTVTPPGHGAEQADGNEQRGERSRRDSGVADQIMGDDRT
jgi:hypothetical protein